MPLHHRFTATFEPSRESVTYVCVKDAQVGILYANLGGTAGQPVPYLGQAFYIAISINL